VVPIPAVRDTTAAAGTEAPAETSAPAGSSAGSAGAAGESLVNGEIKCEQQYAGKTVSLLSPVRNSENDPNAIQIFTDFWKPLADCTGVKIDFQGTDQFEVQAPVLIQGGSPPDVIDFPQPGLMHAGGRPQDPPRRPRQARQRLHQGLA
jgi:alpha-glucoside transport system substrate-binding protein